MPWTDNVKLGTVYGTNTSSPDGDYVILNGNVTTPVYTPGNLTTWPSTQPYVPNTSPSIRINYYDVPVVGEEGHYVSVGGCYWAKVLKVNKDSSGKVMSLVLMVAFPDRDDDDDEPWLDRIGGVEYDANFTAKPILYTFHRGIYCK